MVVLSRGEADGYAERRWRGYAAPEIEGTFCEGRYPSLLGEVKLYALVDGKPVKGIEPKTKGGDEALVQQLNGGTISTKESERQK